MRELSVSSVETRTGGEYTPADRAVADLETHEHYDRTKLARIRRVAHLPENPRILELGCSSGGNVVAWQRLGCECVGLEPSPLAVENSRILSRKLGITVPVEQGSAEQMPFANEEFDYVNAHSVIEHVQDIERAIAEVYRVLRPSGVFWFNAASCMCPIQAEIRKVPLFGWYPDPVKQRILRWATVHRPELIGHTSYPAVNWFTPWRAREVLYRHGFRKVWDRWDLRGEDEGRRIYAVALRLIRISGLTKIIADIVVPGCSFAAVK